MLLHFLPFHVRQNFEPIEEKRFEQVEILHARYESYAASE